MDDVFSYIDSFTNLERGKIPYSARVYRLDRMKTLLDLFGNPHHYYQCIHVAGTKGKGSTATLLASVIESSGKKTGLYLSPHVSSHTERISVSMNPVESTVLIDTANEIRELVEKSDNCRLPGDPKPTTFELLTLLAFLCFQKTGCRYAVIETGIGGRLDATNVVHPICSVITPLDLEHSELLGTTLDSIAREKGGIIKDRIPVFSSYQQDSVKAIFRSICQEKHSSVVFLDEEIQEFSVDASLKGTTFQLLLRGFNRIACTLSLLGDFQADNASLAYLVLKNCLPWIGDDTIAYGFSKAFLPGRMELISKDPPIVIDGAHTPLSIKRLTNAFRALFQPDDASGSVLIFGAVSGKDHSAMANILVPLFEWIIISKPGSFKENDPEKVYRIFKDKRRSTLLELDPARALEIALLKSEHILPILVTGSFYMISEIRKLYSDRLAIQ